ncbi:DUF1902 domain-containing protein (plasmid) [Acinetobacter sp. SK-43]|uniref:DUF1902 domain-containing protein n=1 Tax=Acinetobacter sp. SK-43 TaxID=2785295 RepID=UPI00188CBAFE|nr:DUF1902 domain-containing protein [Acinetobacter sp. SK-43]MBF4453802.1 DUF1902 domain-containing protein [Acinetobacter sp. SK-43]
MDSKTIRYQNTRTLVEQSGGITNFGKRIQKSQSQASQFAGETPIKGIGNKIARQIEAEFGKPHGWLDIPHNSKEQINSIPDTTIGKLERDESSTLSIVINVDVTRDIDKGVWIADCKAVNVTTEAQSYEELVERFLLIAPQVMEENAINLGAAQAVFQFNYLVNLNIN